MCVASYHDGGNHDGAVFHASGVVRKQRRVLDQHQFVGVVPVADLWRSGGVTKAKIRRSGLVLKYV